MHSFYTTLVLPPKKTLKEKDFAFSTETTKCSRSLQSTLSTATEIFTADWRRPSSDFTAGKNGKWRDTCCLSAVTEELGKKSENSFLSSIWMAIQRDSPAKPLFGAAHDVTAVTGMNKPPLPSSTALLAEQERWPAVLTSVLQRNQTASTSTHLHRMSRCPTVLAENAQQQRLTALKTSAPLSGHRVVDCTKTGHEFKPSK